MPLGAGRTLTFDIHIYIYIYIYIFIYIYIYIYIYIFRFRFIFIDEYLETSRLISFFLRTDVKVMTKCLVYNDTYILLLYRALSSP